MKRITTLIIAVAMVLGSVSAALADGIDVKVKGDWDFNFGWASNTLFKDSVHGNSSTTGDADKFRSRSRVRTQINFITSEYLQAVLMFEIGHLNWGRDEGGKSGQSSGAGLDTDGVNVETKHAYLDWIIPHTEVSVRMGLQPIKTPSTRLGTPVMSVDVAGIVVSSPITDWLSATVLWARPFDRYSDGSRRNQSDEVDIFGLMLPFTFDGYGSFTPYFIYSWMGANSGVYEYTFSNKSYWNSTRTIANKDSTKLWYLGGNFNVTILDPLVFGLDVVYGRLGQVDITGLGTTGDNNKFGTSGWYIGATLDYKFDWGTPGIFGWWASGDKDSSSDNGKGGRLPSFMVDGDSFSATTFGFGGSRYGTEDVIASTGTGTWGIGIQVADVSFIKDLKHTLRVAYYRGTNDSDLIEKTTRGSSFFKYTNDKFYLTDKDSVWEVNFDHTYKIYENLTAVLELGYLNLKADKDVWGSRPGKDDERDDAWKAELNFRYSF